MRREDHIQRDLGLKLSASIEELMQRQLRIAESMLPPANLAKLLLYTAGGVNASIVSAIMQMQRRGGESIALVFARMPSRIRDICEFTRETGLRQDEVVCLRHTAIDRATRTITVENGKGAKVRTVPLTAAAEQIIDRQPRYIGKPLVFWKGKGVAFADLSSRIGGYNRTVARKA
ncbi:MAG TPA: tyrosine-type recombinase/integrase, partial [Sphingomonas sp.]|nr:tyrosine-type recombinase/integrase [Sphingomonas sp.]